MTREKQDRIDSLRAQMNAAPLMEQKLIFREQIKVSHVIHNCEFMCTRWSDVCELMISEQKIYESVA